MATYVNDLRLKEIGTGESSGTWGSETNTNLELIGEALGFGTEAITTNADTHTTTVADGSTDPGRAMYIKYTGTLDSACTITIAPNTMSRMHFIENGTSGSQNIIISQGTGANVTIPAGDVKAVYLDGAGSGAAVVDAFASLNVVDLKVEDDLTVTDDVAIGGLATVGGTLGVTGAVTANAGVSIDNITIDGTEIDLSSGDLSIDIAGNLQIDADDNGEVRFLDGGTQYAAIKKDGNNALFQSIVADGDFIIQGIDGSSFISAISIDMSQAGRATFNEGIVCKSSTGGDFGVNINTASGDSMTMQVVDTGTGSAANGVITTSDGDIILTAGTGLIGAGTTDPSTQFHVSATNNSAGDLYTAVGPGNVPSLTIQNAGTTDNNSAGIFFRDNDGMRSSVAARFVNHSTNETQLRVSTTDSSGNTRERWIFEGSGNLKVITDGQGINFDATEGSGASTTVLDDYEEGTWTPAYSSAIGLSSVSGITSASGEYVKIGKFVHLKCKFTMNGTSGTRIDPGDLIRITGLPYDKNDCYASGTVYISRAFTNLGGFTGAFYWYAGSYAVIQFLGQGNTTWSGDEDGTVYASMNFYDS